MHGNLNALGLIALVFLTGSIIWRYGGIDRKKLLLLIVFAATMLLPADPLAVLILNLFALWLIARMNPMRIVAALLVGWVAMTSLALAVTYRCSSAMSPSLQISLPAFCILLVILFVPRKKTALTASMVLFVLGLALSRHYLLLIASGSYSGAPVSMQVSFDVRKTAAGHYSGSRWHTPLTGLYQKINTW